MFIIEELLKNLDHDYRKKIILFILIIFSTIPISLAIIATNIASFQFKNNTTEINLKAKKQLNDTEFSTKQTEKKLNNLNISLESLERERPRDPLVKEVIQEFREFNPTAEKQLVNSKKTINLLEAITE